MAKQRADSHSNETEWECFAYLTAEKGALYRAIIERFALAKSEFVLHLRPVEIHSQLLAGGHSVDILEVESALDQLETWGNLQSYKDTADVLSLKDFYRKKLLFQLTARGEAVHSATITFRMKLGEQAKLDARALERITDAAAQLCRLATEDQVDGPIVLATLRNICQDADELTQRAQSFFRWLHERTESQQAELANFLEYKERLIEYLQQFIGELIARGGDIAERLEKIDTEAYSRLAAVAASEEVGEPRAGEIEQHVAELEASRRGWFGRLMGLHGWFVGREMKLPQSEQLRAAARAAIPRLLLIASQINERRTSRSNRYSDLRRLAVWFAEAESDAAAHRLFRAAFACSSARHLRVNDETIEQRDQANSNTEMSWLDAPPIHVAPQLRSTGRQPIGSSTRRTIDRSADKAAALHRLNLESNLDDSSRETLIALGRIRLSEIEALDADAFRLLLELLEQAAPLPGSNGSAIATSRDGNLRIQIDPVPEKPSVAALATEAGVLRTQDAWLEVTRAVEI